MYLKHHGRYGARRHELKSQSKSLPMETAPLEGHHSVILEKMGVRENIAIESGAENLKKCLRIKERYHLDHTRFRNRRDDLLWPLSHAFR